MTDAASVTLDSGLQAPELEAFRALGRVLLRLVPDPAAREAARDALLSVMTALGQSEQEGSVCARLSRAVSDKRALAPLIGCGLAADAGQSVASGGESNAPIVIDLEGDRLYLQRSFAEELRLAESLVRYASAAKDSVSRAVQGKIDELARADYERYGKSISFEEFLKGRKAQDDAVRQAVSRRLSMICGGPGTGKTTTVVRILECLMLGQPGMSVVLAAPTGKAASRVLQSVSAALDASSGSYPLMQAAMRDERVIERTVHKLLCSPRSDGVRPDRAHPLEADVLVVDEASMMDMSLAVQLFDILDAGRTRVIILGDQHQLAAVGPGSVLADMTDEKGVLRSLVTRLTVSHRFTDDSQVGRLALAVNEGRLDEAVSVFADESGSRDRVSLIKGAGPAALASKAQDWVRDSLEAYVCELERVWKEGRLDRDEEFEGVCLTLWSLFNESRALAAQRKGSLGVESLNATAEAFIRGRLAKLFGERGNAHESGEFYFGRAVIVRKNSEALGVYNGDVGIMVPDSRGSFIVYFGDTRKRLPAALLPEHETAFAITIHQSQGSEYDRVAVVMPASADSGLATRELLYTAITRAKRSADVFCGQAVLEKAIATATERAAGLADRLRQKTA